MVVIERRLILLLIFLTVSFFQGSPISAAALQTPAEIADIRVEGRGLVLEELILDAFGLKPGDNYSEEEAKKGLERIERFSAVKRADIWNRYDAEGTKVHVTILVKYRSTTKIRPKTTRNFANKLALGLQFTESNFRKRDEDIEVVALFRGATILSGTWKAPSMNLLPRTGIGLKIEYKDYSYPYPEFRSDLVDKRIRRLEPEFSLYFRLSEKLTLVMSPGLDRIFGEEEMIQSCVIKTGLPSCDSGLFSTFSVSLFSSWMDNRVYPTSGYRFELARKEWGLFDADSKIRTRKYIINSALLVRIYRPVLHLRMRGALSSRDAPLLLLDHLGGETTLRGYEYGIFAGENSFLARADLGIPINFYDYNDIDRILIPLEIDLFLDTGACWDNGGPLSRDIFHSGFGFSLNIVSPGKMVIRVGSMWRMQSSAKFYLDVETLF